MITTAQPQPQPKDDVFLIATQLTSFCTDIQGDAENESRFAIGEHAVDRTIERLGTWLRPQVYNPKKPVGYNWTVYLDTQDLSLSRSEPGRPSRRVRVRSYASAIDNQNAPQPVGLSFLELKQRSDGVRTKTRLPVSAAWLKKSSTQGFRSSKKLADLARRADASWLSNYLAGTDLVPRLVTCYRRRSFVGHGGRVRATIDDRIQFCTPDDFESVAVGGWPRHCVSRAAHAILELKWTGKLPEWLSVLAGPLNSLENGKFRTGMKALAG